jgi:hypothetical protein
VRRIVIGKRRRDRVLLVAQSRSILNNGIGRYGVT